MKIPELGIGLTYHPVLDQVIEDHLDLIQVLEIEPQTHWIQPDFRSAEYSLDHEALKKISSFPCKKLIHSIGFPVGGSRLPDDVQYPLHHEMLKLLNAPWMSEHLSFNRAEFNGKEYVTGFMLPPLQTPEGIEFAVRSIKSMKSKVPVPVAIETGVNYLKPLSFQIPDGEFLRRVTEEADCGILLDLHNLLTNEKNGRQPMEEFLAQIPPDRVWEIHLAGGKMREGFYIDSHSGSIPEFLMEKTQMIIPGLKNLGAIIFEMFPDSVESIGFDAIEKDLADLNKIWANRKKKTSITKRIDGKKESPNQKQIPKKNITLHPPEYENNLAALVTGQIKSSDIEELNSDPAIGLISGLISSFRASMVSASFRYTSRLLMISLGVEEYERLLSEFWKQKTPEPFATTEGENFMIFLGSNNVNVFGMNEVMEFERAYIATLIDGEERVVQFPFDPLSFLKAIGEGRKSHEIYSGNYELVIEARQGLTSSFHHQGVYH